MIPINALPACLSLGNQPENNVTPLVFDISAWLEKWPGMVCSITHGDAQGNNAFPVAGVVQSGSILTWTVGEDVTQTPGSGTMVIKGCVGDKRACSTRTGTYVYPGHASVGDPPEILANWLAEAGETVQRCIIAALESGEARDGAVEAREAAEGAAEVSAEHAVVATAKAGEAAGSEETASEKAGQATQALADLLAMLGSQVATLGPDGKLTPAQIPALSINDVFPVADTAEMLALIAERGDTAIIMAGGVVTDSYILMTDDPTDLANWAKLGVSYVANAGHAVTADSATDAQMINGKRMISMTQAQYDIAVKDPDTYYIVTPGGD